MRSPGKSDRAASISRQRPHPPGVRTVLSPLQEWIGRDKKVVVSGGSLFLYVCIWANCGQLFEIIMSKIYIIGIPHVACALTKPPPPPPPQPLLLLVGSFRDCYYNIFIIAAIIQ